MNPHQLRLFRRLKFGLLVLGAFVVSCAPQDMITIRKSNGEELQVQVEFARTNAEREKGLMFRQKLPEGHGMLFLFPAESANNFWMKNTPVALDIIFAHYGKIIDISRNAQPYSEKLIVPHGLFTEVLEVPAGYVDRHHIQIGDKILLD